jgi:transcriptional regulator with XRE-family HTH domain
MIDLERDRADIFDKNLVFDLPGVGQRIREARRRYKLSQSDFADGLHISRKWLSELENGKKCPSGLLLLGMECRYAVSRDWILGCVGPMLVCSELGEKNAEAVMLLKSFGKLSKDGREKIINLLNAFLFIEEN